MNKESFYDILCHYTPEELNAYISEKGKKKMVNAITFIKNNENTISNDNNINNTQK